MLLACLWTDRAEGVGKEFSETGAILTHGATRLGHS